MNDGSRASDGSPKDGAAISRQPQSWVARWRQRRKEKARRRAEAAPLLEHLEELRRRFLKASVALIVASVVAFLFRNWIFDLLVAPFREVTEDQDLVFFRPTEAFSLFMQISLFGGVVLASPVIIYQIGAFISPAVSPRHKRWSLLVTGLLVVLFVGGILLGYWSLERGLGFLIGFGSDRIEPVIGADYYLTFTLRFLLVFGVAFEFPVFLFAMAAAGAVGWRALARGRRWVAVIIVTVGAVATPSGDPLTLLLLAVPLYLLYEITIWVVRFGLRR